MKRFSIVCALVLLLNVLCPVGHVHAEEISTPTDVECTHWRYCNANTCGACEAAYEGEHVQHAGNLVWMYEFTHHWQFCTACNNMDEKMNYGPHDSTEGCSVCGFDCEHENTSSWVISGDIHYRNCLDCGLSIDHGEHYSDDTPGVCSACGTTYACVHTNQSEWSYDKMMHWKLCIDCGITVEKTYHDQFDNCTICGYVCAHENTEAWKNVGEQHGRDCIDCGMTVDKQDHYSDGEPGNCAVCGGYFVDCANGVHGVMGRFYDETHHWFACEQCEALLGDYSEHFVLCAQPDLTKCQTCDATVDPAKVEMQHVAGEEGWVAIDGYTHRVTCVCGAETAEEGHSKFCQADACEYCGYAGELLNDGVYHNFDGKYEYDEHFHWGVCAECGESENFQSAHIQQDCKSDICQVCGATFDNNQHFGYTDEYEYDESGHWFTCTDCGERTEPQEHMYVCNEPNGCTTCGYKPSGIVNASHWWTEKITDCGEYHARICPECGGEYLIQPHVVSCANPGICVTCGATNVVTESLSHKVSGYESDATSHWQVCSICKQKCYETPHRASCQELGVCVTCGLQDNSIPVNDHDVFNSKVYFDENNHWRICTKCGEKAFEGEHYEYCQDTNGCCYECGYIGDIAPEHQALKAGWTNDADNHWKVCAVCNKTDNVAAHVDENNDEKCDECGYILVHIHTWGEPVTIAATCAAAGSKTTTCTTCGEKTVETIPATGKHTWGDPVTITATCVAAGSKTTACTTCGEKTVETIPATGKHTWETVNRAYATCTRAGRTERVCTVCDELSVTTQAAKGHAYGLVFITEGNGTHAKTCETCGDKHVEACVLNSTEMGNMICAACVTCGYAVYTMTETVLEEVEELTEAKAEIEVKRVENVNFEFVVEPAEEGAETEAEAEPAETADVVLVVHETELEMTVELPDTVNASVKKVLAVSMLKEGSTIQPAGKVKLSIPVVEEEVAGMKLVLMDENGELVEIEYEIIDGVMVFETELVGIFLFVDAEE